MVAKYAIETVPDPGRGRNSEFRYRDPILTSDTLVVAISQLQDLQAIRHARVQRSKVWRSATPTARPPPRDGVIYTHAVRDRRRLHQGLLTSAACPLLALYLAQVKGTRYGDEISQARTSSTRCRTTSSSVLGKAHEIYDLART